METEIAPAQPPMVKVGELEIYLDSKQVLIRDGDTSRPIKLTDYEFRALKALALVYVVSPRTAVNDEALLNSIYWGGEERTSKNIKVFICKMRKKFVSVSPHRHYIETVHGKGYALAPRCCNDPVV